jgi:uncharacterized protein (DUF58 family)
MNQAPDDSISSLFSAVPVIFFLGLLLFVAFFHQEPVMSAICLALLALMLLCRFWARLAAPYVDLSVVSERRRMFPGDEFSLTIKTINRSYMPIWLQAAGPQLSAGADLENDLPAYLNGALPPRGCSSFTWRLKAGRRGVHRLGPSELVAGDLTGFYPQQLPCLDQTVILIYPRLVSLNRPVLSQQEMFGNARARHPVVDPVCITGTRDYQPGRPARNIHWRASARHQRWQEKVFEPSAQAKVIISLEVGGFVRGQAIKDFEHTLEAVASLAVELERQKVQVSFISNGARLSAEPATSELSQNFSGRHNQPDPPVWLAENILESLARLGFSSTGDMAARLTQYSALLRGASLLHCVWQLDQAAAEVRGLCQRRKVPVTLLVAGSLAPGPEAFVPVGRDVLHLSDLVELQSP